MLSGLALLLMINSVSALPFSTNFDYKYTGIVMPGKDTRNVDINVSNQGTAKKKLQVKLKGVNSYFHGGGDTRTVELDAGGSQMFTVTVEPQVYGRQKLEVELKDTDLGVSQVSTLPVDVRKYPAASSPKETPGLSGTQLLMIVLFTTIWYTGGVGYLKD